MELLDSGVNLPQVDPVYSKILSVVNADKAEKRFTVGALSGNNYVLHPVLKASYDGPVRTATFNSGTGEIFVPQRTTAVFVVAR